VIEFQFIDNSDQRVAAWLASRYERIMTEVERGMMRSMAAVSRQLIDDGLGRAALSDRPHILRSSVRQRTSPFRKRTERNARSRAGTRPSGTSFGGISTRKQTGNFQRRSRLLGELHPLLRSRMVEQRIVVLAELSRAIADALES
jgi:hypothetical protein